MAEEITTPNHELVGHSKAHAQRPSKQSLTSNKRKVGRPGNMTPQLAVAIRLLHANGKGIGKRRLAKLLSIGVGSILAVL